MENNPQMNAPVKRNLPRDVFLHLFAMVTLYWSAISVITLCWQYVNHFFPDALNYNYGFSGSIRFAVASLIIVFPLYLLTSWVLAKIYAKESEVRESKIRKWLIYLTLFVAALVIIGDLIFVINTFLGGEITARFILKALSVLVVAAAIFWYYLDDVRRASTSKMAKGFGIASAAVVLILIVGAFFIVGSPMKARSEQFDMQRINDLQSIQSQVVYYYQSKGQLPSSLTDLNDSISGYVPANDPETRVPYEYTVKDPANLKFQLCGTFDLDSTSPNGGKSAPIPAPAMYSGGISQNWNHGAGRVCFDRTIDQQLYPPFKK
ncbi:hypothetical protein KW786_00335 [Candidatus Parcubacteria bacterium]|nr:hypothetical protein [Candidatus Parcubacteria bacterium]